MGAVSGALVLVLATGIVAACSRPSPENETACKLFASEENDIRSAINLWVADGRPAGGSDLARKLGAQRTSRIKDAASRATSDVAVAMEEAGRLSLAMDQDPSSKDVGTAFFLQVNNVYDVCRKAGVKLEIVQSQD